MELSPSPVTTDWSYIIVIEGGLPTCLPVSIWKQPDKKSIVMFNREVWWHKKTQLIEEV